MGNKQVNRLIFDLCALLSADPHNRLTALVELEKDGVELYCFADLTRKMLMNALLETNLLGYFDDIFYPEKILLLEGPELRMLSNSYWIRFPYQVDYRSLSHIVGRRRSYSPLLLLGSLYSDENSHPPKGDTSAEED